MAWRFRGKTRPATPVVSLLPIRFHFRVSVYTSSILLHLAGYTDGKNSEQDASLEPSQTEVDTQSDSC